MIASSSLQLFFQVNVHKNMAPRKLKKESSINSAPVEPTATLSSRDEQPPTLLVLPETISPDAKFVSLPHPATGKLARYLYCSESSFYEITRIAPGTGTGRSCLLTPSSELNSTDGEYHSGANRDESEEGYILQDAQSFTATPVDIRLFLIPLIKVESLDGAGNRPQQALIVEDHLSKLSKCSKHFERLLRFPSVRRRFERAIVSVFEPVDALGEIAYRPDASLLFKLLVEKASRLVNDAWPSSLESYIQRQLEVPAIVSILDDAARTGNSVGQGATPVRPDEQGSNDKSPSQAGVVQRDTPTTLRLTATEAVVKQMRLKTALEFIASSYCPPPLRKHFDSLVASNKYIDLGSLQAYLAEIDSLKEKAQALRSMSENIVRKRTADEVEDEERVFQAEKRQKKEEEEKKRKQETRAIKDLRKTDTSGMKKLSSFFSKKAPAAAG